MTPRNSAQALKSAFGLVRFLAKYHVYKGLIHKVGFFVKQNLEPIEEEVDSGR